MLLIVLWNCSRPKVFFDNLTSFFPCWATDCICWANFLSSSRKDLFLPVVGHPWENGGSVAWDVLISPKWMGRPKEITNRLSQNQFPGRKLPFPSWQLISFSILLKMLTQVDSSYIWFIFFPLGIEVVIKEFPILSSIHSYSEQQDVLISNLPTF